VEFLVWGVKKVKKGKIIKLNFLLAFFLIPIIFAAPLFPNSIAEKQNTNLYPGNAFLLGLKNNAIYFGGINKNEVESITLLGNVSKITAMKKVHKEIKTVIENFPGKTIKLIIQLNDENKLDAVAGFVNSQGGEVKNKFKLGKSIVAEMPASKVQKIAENSEVQGIWPERKVHALLDKAIPQINAPSLWAKGYTGKGIKIAVLDTGINETHPMLQGKVILQKNFSDSPTTSDAYGHGTHVAAIAAGTNVNGGQYNGVAPNALLINAKVLNDNGDGTDTGVIDAINWVVDPDGNPETSDGADIINLSLGGAYSDLNSPLNQAIRDAVNAGVAVVVAAGNCGKECPSSACDGFTGITTPGNTAEAITVGAVNKNSEWACFSSGEDIAGIGIKPDLVAPGVEINSAYLNNQYTALSGTSMSTPFISGASALILEAKPSLSPMQIKELLESTALDLGKAGKDTKYGSGLIDLNAIKVEAKQTPMLSVEPPQISEYIALGETIRKTIKISNKGASDLVIEAIKSPEWIKTTLENQTIAPSESKNLNIEINSNELGLGNFEGTLSISSKDENIAVPAKIIVYNPNDPKAESSIELEPTYVWVNAATAKERVFKNWFEASNKGTQPATINAVLHDDAITIAYDTNSIAPNSFTRIDYTIDLLKIGKGVFDKNITVLTNQGNAVYPIHLIINEEKGYTPAAETGKKAIKVEEGTIKTIKGEIKTQSDNDCSGANFFDHGPYQAPGAIDYEKDVDWYEIEVHGAGRLDIALYGPSGADFDLYVYNSCGGSIACSSTGSSATERCVLNFAANMSYLPKYIKVAGYSGTGSYTLRTENFSCDSGWSQCVSSYWEQCYSPKDLCCNGDNRDSDSKTVFGQYYCQSNLTWANCTYTSHSACWGPFPTDVYCTYPSGLGTWLFSNCSNSASGCGSWQSNYCSDNDVYRKRTCHEFDCASSSCYTNSYDDIQLVQDCGSSGYSGSNYCYDNDVYKDYINRGCSSGSCYSTTDRIKQQECGSNYCDPWGPNYCSGNSVYHQRTCYNKGCSGSSCYSSSYPETEKVKDCPAGCNSSTGDCTTCTAGWKCQDSTHKGYQNSDCTWSNVTYCEHGCDSGTCIACTSASHCGTDGYTGSPYCSNNDVYQNYRTYSCNNPGTALAYCSSTDTGRPKQDCGDSYAEPWGTNYCSNGNVVHSRKVHDKGCLNGSCYDNVSTQTEIVNECQFGCNDATATCKPFTCPAGQCTSTAWQKCFMPGELCCTGDHTFGQFYCQSNASWANCTDSEHSSCQKISGTDNYCTFENNEWRWRNCPKGCTNGKCTVNYPIKIQIEESYSSNASEVSAFKQRNDYIKINIYSASAQTISFQFDESDFSAVNGNCANGSMNLNAGNNECKFLVKENVAKGKHYFTAKLSNQEFKTGVEIIEWPNYLIVTDKQKLLERYSNDRVGVETVLRKAYENALNNNGIVYDLSQYNLRNSNPFASFTAYNQSPLAPINASAVNNYALNIASFIKEKCKGCYNVLLLGDDFVVPYYRKSVASSVDSKPTMQKIYSDAPYISTTSPTFGKLDTFFLADDVYFVIPDYMDKTDVYVSGLAQALVDVYKRQLIKGNTCNYYNQAPDYHGIYVPVQHNSCIDIPDQWIGNMQLNSSDNIHIYHSSEITCDSFSKLNKATLVLIGNPELNNAVSCYPWIENEEYPWIKIERSMWDGSKYVIIINSKKESLPLALKTFSQLITSPQMRGYVENDKELTITELVFNMAIGFIPGITCPDAFNFGESIFEIQSTDFGSLFFCGFDMIPFGTIIGGVSDLSKGAKGLISSADLADEFTDLAKVGKKAGYLDETADLLKKYPTDLPYLSALHTKIWGASGKAAFADLWERELRSIALMNPEDFTNFAKGTEKIAYTMEKGVGGIRYTSSQTLDFLKTVGVAEDSFKDVSKEGLKLKFVSELDIKKLGLGIDPIDIAYDQVRRTIFIGELADISKLTKAALYHEYAADSIIKTFGKAPDLINISDLKLADDSVYFFHEISTNEFALRKIPTELRGNYKKQVFKDAMPRAGSLDYATSYEINNEIMEILETPSTVGSAGTKVVRYDEIAYLKALSKKYSLGKETAIDNSLLANGVDQTIKDQIDALVSDYIKYMNVESLTKSQYKEIIQTMSQKTRGLWGVD
jgi:subtilisin family serine protease